MTDAGLEPLRKLAKLRNLYVWKTKISWDAAQAMQTAIPGLQVNLGWDHPQVMKLRLAKEMESAKEISDAAALKAKELEHSSSRRRKPGSGAESA